MLRPVFRPPCTMFALFSARLLLAACAAHLYYDEEPTFFWPRPYIIVRLMSVPHPDRGGTIKLILQKFGALLSRQCDPLPQWGYTTTLSTWHRDLWNTLNHGASGSTHYITNSLDRPSTHIHSPHDPFGFMPELRLPNPRLRPTGFGLELRLSTPRLRPTGFGLELRLYNRWQALCLEPCARQLPQGFGLRAFSSHPSSGFGL